MKYVAFDLETFNPVPESKRDSYDLGITCIAACVVDLTARNPKDYLQLSKVWHGKGTGNRYADNVSQEQLSAFLHWLKQYKAQGYYIVAWNGIGFDFRVIAESREKLHGPCALMAMNSVDPFFQMLCEKGYGIGLNAAANGLGVEGKAEGMDGLAAIEMWKGGREEQEEVLEYVKRDALATARVYGKILAEGEVRWISKSGRLNTWVPQVDGSPWAKRMLRVREAIEIPLPDTSWMDDPWVREEFYDWTGWRPEDC